MLPYRIESWSRDRFILVVGSLGITSVAWLYLVRMPAAMSHASHLHVHAAGTAGALFLMWAVMMVAMMLPSTLPFVWAFRNEQVRRQERQGAIVSTSFFVAGYIALWLAFSGACALLQVWFSRQWLLSPAMSLRSNLLCGSLLMAAGVYQWLPVKNACLRHCRTPLTFLLGNWLEGRLGALGMGLEHGVFCLGCCWMLMLLPFAAGVMNLLWMAALTVLILLEKALPGGEAVARVAGVLLASAGLMVVAMGVAPVK